MKTLKLKTVLLFTAVLISLNVKSQGGTTSNEGCEDCVGGSSVNSFNCVPAATTWFLGGNQIVAPTYIPPGWTSPFPPQTDIGTCNEFPFVLKANNNKSVFILPNSRIGIGLMNSSPSAVLDIKDGNNPSPAHFRIYGDAAGNLESTSDITMNYATGKRFAIHEGAVNAGINRLFLQNGKMGLNNSNPAANLDILDQNAAEIRLQSTSPANSSVWTLNSLSSYNFGLDNSGTGFIGSNINSPTKLIQFRINSSSSNPQVWIGKRPTTGNHTDFSLAVDGKLVANSIYVTLQGNWADFVFEDNYQLMPLSELEQFYKSNRHLPNIPSTKEMKTKGIGIEEINTLLLQKVEELTLYLVAQQKEINKLKAEIIK